MYSRIVVWAKELLVGGTESVSVGGKLFKEVKLNSDVTQRSVFGTLLFVVNVNVIWRNIESSVRLFADSCKICRIIRNKNIWNFCRRI